jgi:Tfp pilus assembly protein PilO
MTVLESILAALISAVLSSAGSVFIASGKINARLTSVELKVAEKYVSKEDLNVSMRKFEDHLTRIENKFDQLLLSVGNGKEGIRG